MLYSNRRGGVLIIVLMLMVLLVTMVIAFMSLISNQRGSALTVASQSHAEMAVDSATANVQRIIMEDTKNFSAFRTSPWRTEFAPIYDPDGDPFTETGNEWTIVNYTVSSMFNAKPPSLHPLINAPDDFQLLEMTGRNLDRGYDVSTWYKFGWHPVRPFMRWINVAYYDDDFLLIDIDPTLGDAAKADLKRKARYVARYCVQVLDLQSMQSYNNNYPGAPVLESAGDNYIRYQNYLRTHGRSLKSQAGVVIGLGSSMNRQLRSTDASGNVMDPLDEEPFNVLPGGEIARHNSNPGTGTYYGLHGDRRIRIERIFRGEPLKWVEKTYDATEHRAFLAPYQKGGRVNSWEQVRLSFELRGRNDGHDHTDDLGTTGSWTPHGIGLLDSTLSGSDEVSTPWQVNFLTLTPVTFSRMVFGLSSELKKTARYGEDQTVDLFGREYPEPFPLNLEDGKEVNLIGEVKGRNEYGNAETNDAAYNNGRFFGGTATNHGWLEMSAGNIYEGSRNSYWHDVAQAIRLAAMEAHKYWGRGEAGHNSGESSIIGVAGDKAMLKYPGGSHPTYINPTETNTDLMLQQVIRETYRILGERVITDGSPATSSENMDPSYIGGDTRSLLEGGTCYVGLGANHSPGDGAGGNSQIYWMRKSKLSEQVNTRAMEYMLNDVMISLFGKANPYYESSRALSDIAVDFNGDGHAESTVTGWYDIESNDLVWSWWWDGVGPYVDFGAKSDTHAFMKRGGWYRFYPDGKIFRQVNSDWVELTGSALSDFTTYNTIFLTGNARYPIKPFSKTGRLFIGKSRVFQAFIRGEVYNINANKVMASSHRSFIYRSDPNADGDFDDAFITHQKEYQMNFHE